MGEVCGGYCPRWKLFGGSDLVMHVGRDGYYEVKFKES